MVFSLNNIIFKEVKRLNLNMTDTNYYDYQAYGTQVGEIGTTNVLPTIQGTTEVLSPIGGDFGTTFVQGENTVLQDTAGLGEATTTTGYFGETTFGTTQEYPATTYGGEQVLQTTTTQPTTIYGETQFTTDNNTFFPGVTTTDNTALYGEVQSPTTVINDGTAIYGGDQVFTGTNVTQGTTQVLPATNVDANTFFAGATTTTTQTTYGTTGVSPSPIQTTLGTTQIPTTNQVTTLGNGNIVPVNAQAVPPQNVQTNVAVAQNQIIQNQTPATAQAQGQLRKSNQQKLPGGKVIDEDFRRGRPVYNDKYSNISKYEMPRILPRPVYNARINNQSKASKIVGVNQVNPLGANKINNIGLGVNPGLSKLERGVTYDPSVRGITPFLNKAGLGQINNNIQPAGQNQKNLGNIKDYL